MSSELQLLMVDEAVMARHGQGPMLAALWSSSFVLREVMGLDPAQASHVAKERLDYLDALSANPDDILFGALWPDLEILIRSGELPREILQMGKEWQRLDSFFSQESDPSRRELLSAALRGTRSCAYPVKTTYGECRLVQPEDTGRVAQALREVTLRKHTQGELTFAATPHDTESRKRLADFYQEASDVGASVICGFI